MGRGTLLKRMRAAGLLLALFALTFKAMLPPGFMLAADAGQIAITLCSGNEIVVDATGHAAPEAPVDGEAAQQHCTFALVSAPALDTPNVETPAPRELVLVFAQAPLRAPSIVATRDGPPLPARGPPTQA